MYHSLCCSICPCCLCIWYIIVCVSLCHTPILPLPLFPLLIGSHIYFLYLWVYFYFACIFACIFDFTFKWYHVIFVFIWLISQGIIISRSFPIAVNGRTLFFVLRLSKYSIVYHIFIPSYLDRHFHILAIVNSAAMNTGMQVSFHISVFILFRSGISGSYGSSSLSFLRKFYTALQSGCPNLHSHQPCKRGSLFSTSSPTFVIFRVFYGSHSKILKRTK